ncbi:hypothetical protein THAOC_01857 [Thalassiosira oceanica]|uniref:FAD dependent oxidoreductase domain-containing protein n=1 Tax=Thalassiosira oceanica TaxID=159749 RepID=K0TH95_THAOC|nr:hypothetical protein THAOC_01857 [Thalassiosira oceanica]|eukprot:EJK76384.1 hypothetical protein THAOC_01857 [Thalassiosira oceanica]
MSSASPPTPTSPRSPRNIVVIGGGIQATSVAFHISQSKHLPDGSSVTILEAQKLANAASGKGGGFMARSWGDGSPTQTLHELAFDMYEELCPMLGVQSYRKLPVLSVSPGPTAKSRQDNKSKNPSISDIVPNWLDGSVGRLAPMGFGDDTAQVTPREVVERMIEFAAIDVVLGKCVGVDAEVKGEAKAVTGVKYVDKETGEERVLPASDVVVSAGPWSCNAEHWFDGAVSLPMDGVKSTSIVWRPPRDGSPVDATALFCGEDPRYNTHLECYPRPDGTIYLCGIGGSDYISTQQLQNDAFLTDCPPKEDRVEAATASFQMMSHAYQTDGELLQSQACMRPCPPDAKPYMGRIDGYHGAFINAGHNCWGIAWAPACGKAMAELVLEGSCKSVNLNPFNPSRFTAPGSRGGRGRKKKGVSVGEQW